MLSKIRKKFNIPEKKEICSGTVDSLGYQHKDCDLERVHKAAAVGDLVKLKELVTKKNKAINKLDKKQRTALHIACAFGHDQVVRFLVERNANLKCRDNQGQTALMKAVQGNHQTCVSILLENHADPKMCDFEGNTALHMAASISGVSIAGQLLHHEANINSHTNIGVTPLIVAVCKDYIEMARFLLKEGANVNGTDCAKKSPLMFAAEKGQSSMVRLLLEHDASTSLQDFRGWYAVDYAMNNGHCACSNLIKQATHKDDAVYLDHGVNGEERSIAFQREAPSQSEWDFTETPSSSEVYEVEENREEGEDPKDQNEEQKEHLEDEIQLTEKELLLHELSKPGWDSTDIFSEVFEQLKEKEVLPKEVANVYGEERAISSQSEDWDSPEEEYNEEKEDQMSQEGQEGDPKDQNEEQKESLEDEVHRITQQLKEELQMDVLRKEKEMLTAQVKEQDRALQAQKELATERDRALLAQKELAKVQHECTQEQLAKAQSECQLLRQQLKEVNNKKVTEPKFVTDTQQCFSNRLSKLPSDCEEQVQLVEERNKELLSKAAELQDKVCMLEDEKNKREVSMRQLQQELSDTQEKLSKNASQEVNTQYCNDLEKEKARILKNVNRLKEKLAESENQRVQAEKCYRALKTVAEQQSLKIEAMEKAAQECYAVMVRGHPEELFSNFQNRTISLEDQHSREEQKQNTGSLSAQEYQALWEQAVKSCSMLGLRVSELEKEKRKLTLHNEIVKQEPKKIVEKKVADALLEREKTRSSVLQTEVCRLHTLVKNKLCDKDMGGEKTRVDISSDLQKMKDLQVQLDKETVWRCQLEKDNCDLHKELMSLQCSLQNRQRMEHELRTQMEATQRECRQVKERAKQELLTKLEEVNHFLQIQNASQEALHSQLEQRIRMMEGEVSRARFSEQECLSRLDSNRMELDWYKTKYPEEQRLRMSLVSKFQRADSHRFEANAVRMSTLFST